MRTTLAYIDSLGLVEDEELRGVLRDLLATGIATMALAAATAARSGIDVADVTQWIDRVVRDPGVAETVIGDHRPARQTIGERAAELIEMLMSPDIAVVPHLSRRGNGRQPLVSSVSRSERGR
ncbi:MAG: hypothetical protein AB7P02_20720 [Alphaproteobacteria bacterium]